MRFDTLVQVKMWAVEIASTAVFLVFVFVVAQREIKHLLGRGRRLPSLRKGGCG